MMKTLLLIVLCSFTLASIGQKRSNTQIPSVGAPVKIDTLELKLKSHHTGKNYIAWIDAANEISGTFVIEKMACDTNAFVMYDIVSRPAIAHNVTLGFWWNDEGDPGCEYRVLVFDDPEIYQSFKFTNPR